MFHDAAQQLLTTADCAAGIALSPTFVVVVVVDVLVSNYGARSSQAAESYEGPWGIDAVVVASTRLPSRLSGLTDPTDYWPAPDSSNGTAPPCGH